MSESVIFGGWTLHEDTRDMVNSKITHLEGWFERYSDPTTKIPKAS
jgi:hypothetical protein